MGKISAKLLYCKFKLGETMNRREFLAAGAAAGLAPALMAACGD